MIITATPARAARAAFESYPVNPIPTRVIEIGEVTAGIAVPEHGGVRFFSSERSFDALDGVLYPSVERAARAARGHLGSMRGRAARAEA